jgi:hypothetical protein
MTKRIATIIALTVLFVAGILGTIVSWLAGSVWATVAFGLGALAVGLLVTSTFLDLRRRRRAEGGR